MSVTPTEMPPDTDTQNGSPSVKPDAPPATTPVLQRRAYGVWVARHIPHIVLGLAVLGLVVLSMLTYRESYLQLRDREKPGLPQAIIPEPLPTLSPEVVQALSPEVAAQIDATWRSVEQTRAAAEQARLDAVQALRDVDRTDNNLSQLFSFLQAASVLVGLALGATAYFGFRSASQSREDLNAEIKKSEDQRESIKAQQDKNADTLKRGITALARQQKRLEDLENQLTPFVGLGDQLHNNQEMITYLMLATHELRLRNYVTAYDASMHVLTFDSQNPLALYMAGWLELQYINDMFEDGITHLKQAHDAAPTWPTAMAALGVALRRQARNLPPEERAKVERDAVYYLEKALDPPNDKLIDLNQESLWGPVAGIQRDRGDYGEALKTYEKACQVTPGSSYPHGNLAALLLHEGKSDPDSEYRARAITEFKRTSELALAELVLLPNDYFHMMDIAMARTVCLYEEPHLRDTVEEYFRDALNLKPSPEMLGVSRRGWQFLLDSCPDESDWDTVRQEIQNAIQQIDTLGGAPSA